MSGDPQPKTCLACQRTDEQTPLIALDYRGSSYWICPQHMPILIHNPQQLMGKLPGAENLQAAEHDD